jgi:formate hydrogenlyase subunit 6/NADH:ubiquinone oxidoreductase subunit I
MSYRKAECIGCEKCVAACPVQVIGWDSAEKKPVLCVFCGQCVQFCPHDCLEMVEVP